MKDVRFMQATGYGTVQYGQHTFTENAIHKLLEREQTVIELRAGLRSESGEKMSLEEVGSLLGVTRERVRQIEAKAIRKLTSPMWQANNLAD